MPTGTLEKKSKAASPKASQGNDIKLIFELSAEGKKGCFYPEKAAVDHPIESVVPKDLLRDEPVGLPSVSEPELVRHFTTMSQRNFSIDTQFYPLGSCTMKYNPRFNEKIAARPEFANLHPLQDVDTSQTMLEILHEMEYLLTEITGMKRFTFQPAAGAHGEYVGLQLAIAYHRKNGDHKRTKVIVPDSSHGTNPATATLCGCEVIEIPSDKRGLVDINALQEALSDEVACLMLTNPNTLGLFEKDILEIARLVHKAGGFLYYDGANMNALFDIARPGDMGFDIMHLNLHKSFSTPHGGGGPGAGPVGVSERLVEFLPYPMIDQKKDGSYFLNDDIPNSIGKVKAFYGNIGVVLRAYTYIKTHGLEGLRQVSRDAILNANYVMKKLEGVFDVPFPSTCMHEFVLTTKKEGVQDIHSIDVGKRLLDYGYHAPTVAFPLIVPEALMIEPTETESKETLDQFVEALREIAKEMKENPEIVRTAPHALPVKRCDEVGAARNPNLKFGDCCS